MMYSSNYTNFTSNFVKSRFDFNLIFYVFIHCLTGLFDSDSEVTVGDAFIPVNHLQACTVL